MQDSTSDAVPLTPLVVDVVTFDRAPLGRRGYHEDQVDEYLDRIQATLAGTDNLTAQEVREVVFDAAPLIRRGYHEDQVDDFLDLVVAELDARERSRSTPGGQRRTPRPATRSTGAPVDASEQTSPVLPKLPAEQPTPASPALQQAAAPGTASPSYAPAAATGVSNSPAANPAYPQAAATGASNSSDSNPSFPPAAATGAANSPAASSSYPQAAATGASFSPATGSSPSLPQATATGASYPPAGSHSYPPAAASSPSLPQATATGASYQPASNPSFRPVGEPAPSTRSSQAHPGRGPLALPLPPTPPDERGYHPTDVARLVALLNDPAESPSSAAITGMRLNRMEAGQGYHAGAVDAMRAIWITELRRRGL